MKLWLWSIQFWNRMVFPYTPERLTLINMYLDELRVTPARAFRADEYLFRDTIDSREY